MHDSLTLFPDPVSRPPIPPVRIDPASGVSILEEGFPLDASSDVALDEAGMTLWARVSWDPAEYARSIPWYSGRMGVKSEMVFKCPCLDAGEVEFLQRGGGDVHKGRLYRFRRASLAGGATEAPAP